MRLYTNNHASCVAVGQVQPEETARSLLEEWGSVLKLVGRPGTRSGGIKRVVVKVVDVLKPASLLPHKGASSPAPDGQPSTSAKDAHTGGGFVLWDLADVRLSSAHRPFQGTPIQGGGADPEAYKDDFFDAPRPAQAVYRNGESKVGESFPVLFAPVKVIHAMRKHFPSFMFSLVFGFPGSQMETLTAILETIMRAVMMTRGAAVQQAVGGAMLAEQARMLRQHHWYLSRRFFSSTSMVSCS